MKELLDNYLNRHVPMSQRAQRRAAQAVNLSGFTVAPDSLETRKLLNLTGRPGTVLANLMASPWWEALKKGYVSRVRLRALDVPRPQTAPKAPS